MCLLRTCCFLLLAHQPHCMPLFPQLRCELGTDFYLTFPFISELNSVILNCPYFWSTLVKRYSRIITPPCSSNVNQNHLFSPTLRTVSVIFCWCLMSVCHKWPVLQLGIYFILCWRAFMSQHYCVWAINLFKHAALNSTDGLFVI